VRTWFYASVYQSASQVDCTRDRPSMAPAQASSGSVAHCPPFLRSVRASPWSACQLSASPPAARSPACCLTPRTQWVDLTPSLTSDQWASAGSRCVFRAFSDERRCSSGQHDAAELWRTVSLRLPLLARALQGSRPRPGVARSLLCLRMVPSQAPSMVLGVMNALTTHTGDGVARRERHAVRTLWQ
jgi:hypothetical protein